MEGCDDDDGNKGICVLSWLLFSICEKWKLKNDIEMK